YDAVLDLAARRRAVRALVARVRRDDVPEENLVLEVELGEHAVDDRRRRLGRPRPRELPLRGERNPRDTRAAIAGRFADEQDSRACALVEIALEPSAQERRALAVAVEVVRR